jgi:toxin CcdB
MARFDVHRLADGGYVVDCQADLLANLSTRFVAPLVPIEHMGTRMARLNPQFEIEGQEFVMMTQLAGSVPARSLGAPVLSLDDPQEWSAPHSTSC